MTLKNELAWIIRRRLLPKPAKKPAREHKTGPLIVAGLFSTGNGIGRSARLHYQALRTSGVPCKAIDLSHFFGVADMQNDTPFEPAIPSDTLGTLLLCLNPLEAEAALYSPQLRQASGWRIIGNWVWELPRAPKRWNSRSAQYTEIWVPSEFIKDALEPISSVPVKIVPLCLSETALIDQIDRPPLEETEVRFLIAADGWSSFERKNVLGGLKAYKLAFPSPSIASLIIKCRNLDTHSEFGSKLYREIEQRPDISVLSDTVSDAEMQTMLAKSDAVISLHRSEGFGLVLAEAMLQSKPVIATGWSGNMQFMDTETAILIDHKMIPVEDPFGVYPNAASSHWADPDIGHAARAIRSIADQAGLRRELGEKARNAVLRTLNPEVIAQAL